METIHGTHVCMMVLTWRGYAITLFAYYFTRFKIIHLSVQFTLINSCCWFPAVGDFLRKPFPYGMGNFTSGTALLHVAHCLQAIV